MNLSKYRSIVFMLVTGGLLTLVMILLAFRPIRAAGPWYVAPGGNDSDPCTSPGTACATINGAITKASPGDTIYVATGTYTGTGDEVVLLDKDATLSGGWDASFTTQSGTSTIDGEDARRGMTSLRTALVERFTVLNGLCGGIKNRGTLTLNSSTVSDNSGCGLGAGGITNEGPLTLNNSTISRNTAGVGGGIANWSNATLVNSTVSGNSAALGGGIEGGGVTLQNSILAGNTASEAGPDCRGTIGSLGHNLVGDTSGCTFTPATGDLTNVSANLGPLMGSPGYHPLLSSSPAIDAVPLAQCTVATDQRGVARPQGPACDMGAYEYTIPGPAASILAFGGTPQTIPPSLVFWKPLQAGVLDNIGTPVSNTLVTFSAPASGASGAFADTGTATTTAVTDERGIATAAAFTANGLGGSYAVTATVSGIVTPANFLLSNSGWYVAPSGNDANDCQTPTTPCATISGSLGKASFAAGDTVLVASGTYTGTADEVVLLDKSATLSGGWDGTFTTQSGTSTIDGEGMRRGITVNSGVTAIVERFTVQSSTSGIGNSGTLTLNNCTVSGNAGIGIVSDGILTLNDCTVSGNSGAGITNDGTLILNNSTVSGNTAGAGGGIYNAGTSILNNSTVSSNTADRGAGIYNRDGPVTLNNSTVSGNTTNTYGGGIYNDSGTVTLQNTVVAGNIASGTGPDCGGTVGSSGHNLVGDTSDCAFTPGTGDLTNIDAKLGPLEGSPGYHPLLSSSPAIDAGSCSATPTDQRGKPRPIDMLMNANADDGCDIGAYEMQPLELSTKAVDQTIASPGEPLTCTIAVSNGGATDITSVQMTDTLPIFLTYTDDSLTATGGDYGYSSDAITWTGSVNAGQAVTITFGVTVSQTASIGTIVNTAVISGGGEIVSRSASLDVRPHDVYLPCITRNYCPDFFDDFSNPASGWDVVDNSYERSEYLNGEYRVLSKQSGYFYLFRAPACDRQNYTVEADARWAGTPGSSYGLIFGITGGYGQYYLFDMNTDFKQFRLLRRDPTGFLTVVPVTGAPAINGGTASNHLKVTRYGTGITLEVNGTVLGTWYDGTIGGLTGAGLVTNPYGDNPTSDARFDNFSMVALPGGRAVAQEPDGLTDEMNGLAVPNARRDPVPIDMGW